MTEEKKQMYKSVFIWVLENEVHIFFHTLAMTEERQTYVKESACLCTDIYGEKGILHWLLQKKDKLT